MIPPSRPERVGAAVLAGGAASRMGGAKAEALLAGKPLISYPVDSLRGAGLEPFVVTKSDRPVGQLPGLECVPVIIEPDQPRHPLLGVLTALERNEGADVIVVACDLPLLPPAFLCWLAAETAGTIVPRVNGRLQPLAARYGSGAVETVRAAVTNEGSVNSAIGELDPVFIDEDRLREFGEPARMFENVNSPEDLHRVEHLLTT